MNFKNKITLISVDLLSEQEIVDILNLYLDQDIQMIEKHLSKKLGALTTVLQTVWCKIRDHYHFMMVFSYSQETTYCIIADTAGKTSNICRYRVCKREVKSLSALEQDTIKKILEDLHDHTSYMENEFLYTSMGRQFLLNKFSDLFNYNFNSILGDYGIDPLENLVLHSEKDKCAVYLVLQDFSICCDSWSNSFPNFTKYKNIQ